MAGMGPPPKPPEQRRRTNATLAMVQLPLEGYKGTPPEFPLDNPSWRETERWATLWRLPVAVMWARQRCELVVARYVRNCISIENGGVSVATAHLSAEVRQQEDRLGLSPMALLRLRWEVMPDQVEEQRDTRERGVRRLRAVDPSVAAEG
jgi:hypothetical protein